MTKNNLYETLVKKSKTLEKQLSLGFEEDYSLGLTNEKIVNRQEKSLNSLKKTKEDKRQQEIRLHYMEIQGFEDSLESFRHYFKHHCILSKQKKYNYKNCRIEPLIERDYHTLYSITLSDDEAKKIIEAEEGITQEISAHEAADDALEGKDVDWVDSEVYFLLYENIIIFKLAPCPPLNRSKFLAKFLEKHLNLKKTITFRYPITRQCYRKIKASEVKSIKVSHKIPDLLSMPQQSPNVLTNAINTVVKKLAEPSYEKKEKFSKPMYKTSVTLTMNDNCNTEPFIDFLWENIAEDEQDNFEIELKKGRGIVRLNEMRPTKMVTVDRKSGSLDAHQLYKEMCYFIRESSINIKND